MSTRRLRRLGELGQSVWLDFIRRDMLRDGALERLVREDGVTGLTSNPTIFEQAIAAGEDYAPQIAALARRGLARDAIAERLVLDDVSIAAKLLGPVHERTGGRDGYVSIEVSPDLAHDTEATVAQALRLNAELGRPNVMIKVPGTRAGLPAIRRLVAAGVNVNVTLLFGRQRYDEVLEAWLSGLEERVRAGGRVDRCASVASFFLSRIDTVVDRRLDALGGPRAGVLRGRAAVASAQLAYQRYLRLTASARWKRLATRGARPQRLLWASTSTKDPAYPELKYVEPLIGPDTVTTLPPSTLAAYRERGDPAPRIREDLARARAVPGLLAALGIDLRALADELEEDGVAKFRASWRALLDRVGRPSP